jgi:hypothetical protein
MCHHLRGLKCKAKNEPAGCNWQPFIPAIADAIYKTAKLIQIEYYVTMESVMTT